MIRIFNFFIINKQNIVFTKQYKDSYKKLWIHNIRDYTP